VAESIDTVVLNLRKFYVKKNEPPLNVVKKSYCFDLHIIMNKKLDASEQLTVGCVEVQERGRETIYIYTRTESLKMLLRFPNICYARKVPDNAVHVILTGLTTRGAPSELYGFPSDNWLVRI